MTQFVRAVRCHGLTEGLAKTPLMFTKQQIQNIDAYLKTHPKVNLGGDEKFRGFNVGLGEFFSSFIARKSDSFAEEFLKSATDIIPLVQDEDSQDEDTHDEHDEDTCLDDTLDDSEDAYEDRYGAEFLGFVEDEDMGEGDEASYKDRYSPGFQGSDNEDDYE